MSRNHLRLFLGMALLLCSTVYLANHVAKTSNENRFGLLLHETRSEFSHIRIREKGSVRCLLFVDKNGKEQRQSAINLAAPEENQLGYAKGLFSSFLFCHPQNRVLIVGLGGGGMVQYLNHAFPGMTVEAVEIDPVVVSLAAEYFKTVPGPKTVIHTKDAFAFFEEDRGGYDAIYMDAFLRPPADSELTEKTTRLKTEDFLKTLQSHLNPGGVVAFTLIEREAETPGNIASIRRSFPGTFFFSVPNTGNLVVIGTNESPGPDLEALRKRAVKLDETLVSAGLSFRSLAENLRP